MGAPLCRAFVTLPSLTVPPCFPLPQGGFYFGVLAGLCVFVTPDFDAKTGEELPISARKGFLKVGRWVGGDRGGGGEALFRSAEGGE